jgi:rare lipoprotein A
MLVLPLVSLRHSHTSTRPTSLAAGVQLTHRSPVRASRSAWLGHPTTTTTIATMTTTKSAPTTAKPTTTTVRRTTTTTARAIVHAKTTPTTARPTPTTAAPAPPSSGQSESGKASWYDQAPDGTCAHKTLPMGTIVKVTNTANGKSTTCRVADRGPYHDGWIIDLAKSTFAQIAPTSAGVISVTIEW